MKKSAKKRNARIPDAETLQVPEATYQPSRKELREELDMPGLSLNDSRKAFAKPFNFKSI